MWSWLNSFKVGAMLIAMFCHNVGLSQEVIAPNIPIEICNNGIDDDGDGLIDCSDCDCSNDQACEASAFLCKQSNMANCIETSQLPKSVLFETKIEASSEIDINGMSLLLTGDVDNDGEIEIVARKGLTENRIVILNGITLQEELSFEVAYVSELFEAHSLSIVDIDNDNEAEIFIAIGGNSYNVILALKLDGTIIYETDFLPISYAAPINFADFNQDGIPELYVANFILNAVTGEEIISIGQDFPSGLNSGVIHYEEGMGTAVAADVLTENDCEKCAGLELIAGPVVYAVDVDSKEYSIVRDLREKFEYELLTDGYTGVINWNEHTGDVSLDVAVMSNEGFYVWDVKSETLIGSYLEGEYFDAKGGKVSMSDIDGDGEIEAVWMSDVKVICLENDFSKKWEYGNDESLVNEESMGHAPVIFDFNNDGNSEVVFRDWMSTTILNGITGKAIQVLNEFNSYEGIGLEYPVIVDVDQDGEAELLIVSGKQGKLSRIGNATDEKWVGARTVHNQHTNLITNIDENLKVAQFQKKNSGFLNRFLAPLPIIQNKLKPNFQLIDVSMDTLDCENERVKIRIKSQFENVYDIDSVSISIYKKGREDYWWNQSQIVSLSELENYSVWVSSVKAQDSLKIRINDIGRNEAEISPEFEECSFEDNQRFLEIDLCLSDQKSTYILMTPKYLEEYSYGEVLAIASDSDGRIVKAKLKEGRLPSGVRLNERNGSAFIGLGSILAPGEKTTAIIVLTDILGQISEVELTLGILKDEETVFVEKNQSTPYNNGLLIGELIDLDGAFKEVILMEGVLPVGIEVSENGKFKIENSAILKLPQISKLSFLTIDQNEQRTFLQVELQLKIDQEAVYYFKDIVFINDIQENMELAIPLDADGEIISCSIASGDLPGGLRLNKSNGKIVVDDLSKLERGILDLEVQTIDFRGQTSISSIQISFIKDQEAYYETDELKFYGPFSEKQTLISPIDQDGEIIETLILEGEIPGIKIASDGSLMIESMSNFTYEHKHHVTVQTIDETGQSTNHSLIVSFNHDGASIYRLIEAKLPEHYQDGETIGVPLDPDGKIIAATIKQGELPSSFFFDSETGKIQINDVSSLTFGETNLLIETIDEFFQKNLQWVKLQILEDQEAFYQNLSSSNPTFYQKGEVVARLQDNDGDIVRVKLLNVFLEEGLKIDEETGTITIEFPALLTGRESNVEVQSIDNHGGETNHHLSFVLTQKREISVSQGISPNGDGLNDVLEIRGLESYDQMELIVFDRRGSKIFESSQSTKRWDAISVTSGTYFYVLKYGNGNLLNATRGAVFVIK